MAKTDVQFTASLDDTWPPFGRPAASLDDTWPPF
jgi:hypothetical protein